MDGCVVMPQMTNKELEDFLIRPLVVSFTTLRLNGSPQVTSIWYEYEAGKFYCCVGTDSVKAQNIRRDSRVSLCIATHDERGAQFVRETLAQGDSVILAVTPTRLLTESAA